MRWLLLEISDCVHTGQEIQHCFAALLKQKCSLWLTMTRPSSQLSKIMHKHIKKINFMVPTYAVYANKHAAQANTAY